jgi:hypothetical protein
MLLHNNMTPRTHGRVLFFSLRDLRQLEAGQNRSTMRPTFRLHPVPLPVPLARTCTFTVKGSTSILNILSLAPILLFSFLAWIFLPVVLALQPTCISHQFPPTMARDHDGIFGLLVYRYKGRFFSRYSDYSKEYQAGPSDYGLRVLHKIPRGDKELFEEWLGSEKENLGRCCEYLESNPEFDLYTLGYDLGKI